MAKKPKTPPPAITVEVDERWMQEWIAYGFKEMGISLGNHAAFDEYVQARPTEE
jgi:hypothetical protein